MLLVSMCTTLIILPKKYEKSQLGHLHNLDEC